MTAREHRGRAPRCNAWMPNAKEPCARLAGHGGLWGGHRTRWAMDNAYRAQTGHDPDPVVFRAGEWVLR